MTGAVASAPAKFAFENPADPKVRRTQGMAQLIAEDATRAEDTQVLELLAERGWGNRYDLMRLLDRMCTEARSSVIFDQTNDLLTLVRRREISDRLLTPWMRGRLASITRKKGPAIVTPLDPTEVICLAGGEPALDTFEFARELHELPTDYRIHLWRENYPFGAREGHSFTGPLTHFYTVHNDPQAGLVFYHAL